MSDKHYVYSTLAASVEYPVYAKGANDLPVPTSSVIIQGGANIPDQYMRTPEGAVATPVTGEQLEALQQDPTFQLHVKNGFITVRDKETTGEKAASDMEGRDKSAPLVDQDFKESEPQPQTNAKPSNRRA